MGKVNGGDAVGQSKRCLGMILGLAMLSAVTGFSNLASGQSAPTVVLGEAVRRGSTSRVRVELKAQGLLRAGLPPGNNSAEARLPKPQSLDVETRLVFSERVVDLEEAPATAAGTADPRGPTADRSASRGRPRKVVRHVIQAASAVNGDVRPMSAMLRPEMALLVAERRQREGPVVVVSPAGPLTRSELELVQAVGDPLALGDLLPGGAIGVGRSWRVGEAAAQVLSGYDTITANALEAALESVDGTKARFRLHGRIEGSVMGGQGAIACEGYVTFDRQMGWIDRLELNRSETRRPGPIELGLELKSSLNMTRHPEQAPATLSDAALANLSLEITPRNEQLVVLTPDGKASLLHDRHWHGYWDDPKLVILKRVEGGQVVAQCNLTVGPAAGPGRHQDPTQFREDIRRALKSRFGQFLGVGEVDGDPAGGFRFKVGVQGREGNLGVVWYYYLVASPGGDQLVAIFTLAEPYAAAFGEQDMAMIGSLRWNRPQQAPPR
jgi:hypothetical protein